MALEELRLKVDVDGGSTFSSDREYDIYPVDTADATQRKDAFSIAPPGRAPSGNILLGVSGMQADIEIRFTAWDDGTDRANGTAPTGVFDNDTVVTVDEQIEYLEDYIHAPDFLTNWKLDHLTGNMFDDDDVFVEQVDPTYISNQNPKWKPVRIALRRGSSVG